MRNYKLAVPNVLTNVVETEQGNIIKIELSSATNVIEDSYDNFTKIVIGEKVSKEEFNKEFFKEYLANFNYLHSNKS